MFGFRNFVKLALDKWNEYRKRVDIQSQLIQLLLSDRRLEAGSYFQTIQINDEDGTLTNSVHFFFTSPRVKAVFLKENVLETINEAIARYEPQDSCKCNCHEPVQTNVVPFPYLNESGYYDDDY